MLVQSVLFTAVYSGVSLNTDVTKGVVDRFRSLPLWRPAPLVGAVVGDSVRYVIASAVVMVLGLIMGFEAAGGLGGILAAVALIVVFSFGLSWVFTVVGLLMRAPSAVMNTGFMALFPLVFLSNIFVEPETLPGLARVVRRREPDLASGERVARLHAGQRGRLGRRDRARHRRGADRRLRAADRAAVPQPRLAQRPGSAGTSTACSLSASSGTMSSARSWVEASTT